jgi:hypothetical protein
MACTRALCERLDSLLHLSPAAWDARRLHAPRFAPCGAARAASLHLAWRLFLAAYALTVSVVDRAASTEPGRYASYLTVHGVWLTVAYFLCAALTAALAAWRPALLKTRAHALHARATQLLFAIAVPFQLVIVTLYWLLLATPQPSAFRAWDNYESHGIKMALIWADLLVSAMVLPTPQLLVTLACAAVYLAINLGVTLSSYPVYSVLKWNSAASAVLVGGAMAYMIFAFFLAQCLARARDRLAHRLRAAAQGSGSSGSALLEGASSGEGAGGSDALFPEEFSDDAQSRARLCDCRCAPGSAEAQAPAAAEPAVLEL